MKKRTKRMLALFLLINIVIGACAYYSVLFDKARAMMSVYNYDIDKSMRLIEEEKERWKYLIEDYDETYPSIDSNVKAYVENPEPYINGKLNYAFVSISKKIHDDVAIKYYEGMDGTEELGSFSVGELREFGATFDEYGNVIAQTEDYIVNNFWNRGRDLRETLKSYIWESIRYTDHNIELSEENYYEDDNEYIEESALYSKAKKNLLDMKEFENYCNNDIFNFERICVIEYISEGKKIYECYSFVGTPFDEAKECLFFEDYTGFFNYIIIFNVILIIVFKIYCNKKNDYDEYAKDIFLEITDKMAEPVNELKRLNDVIDKDEENSKETRDLIDKAIVDMDNNIRDILDYSKLEVGIITIEPEELELGYLVEAVVEKGSNQYKRNVELDIDREAIIYGDLKKIIRIVDLCIKTVVKKTYNDEKIYVTVKMFNGISHFEVTNCKAMIMAEKNISKVKSLKAGNFNNMEQGGFDLLLLKGYLDLHDAEYTWSNDEGHVKYVFEMSNKEPVTKKAKKARNIKKIYGIVAHEIKTPMNVIKLHNEVMREGMLSPEERRRYKNIISGQIDTIKSQLNQLTAMKQIGDGSIEMTYEWIEIRKLIAQLLKRCDVLLNDKGIEVNIDVDKDLRIIADRNGLESIISNYIINAIKYTKIGGKINITAEETKHVHETSKCVIFKITNDRLAYAFDDKKISSKDTKIINRIERDGLGLLIAKEYLNKHKAKYGYELNGETAEYWFKIKKIRGV